MNTTATATSLYIYGVIPAAEAAEWPAMEGLSSGTVRVVADGGFAALVSALPMDATPGRREDIEAHRRVLAEAIEHSNTIPMRFGMVMGSEGEVRERLLERHAADLSALMSTLEGHVQLTVRGFYTEGALLRAVLADDPVLAQNYEAIADLPELASQGERILLGEHVAKAIDERRAVDERALLDALTPLADDVRADPPSGERGAVNVHLLVDRGRLPGIEAAIETLATALTGYVALRRLGPLPPYSFSELSLEPETETN
jgi:gas vesicle protein GvpL/GvpF